MLTEIPRRLGRNKALDAAVRTILLDHSDACIGDNSINPFTPGVVHLFRTLGILRSVLDDISQREEAETLCAVMLISISMCRFEGLLAPFATVHGKGALQLLRMRGWPVGRDAFEQGVYASMKGTILLHSFVNPDIVLDEDDYRSLHTAFAGPAPEMKVVRLAVQVSQLFAIARALLAGGEAVHAIAGKVQQVQLDLEALVALMRDRLYGIRPGQPPIVVGTRLHAEYLRTYSRALMTFAILLCGRRTLSPDNVTILRDVGQVCEYALQLEEEARVYLPLGWRFAGIMVMPVWCAAESIEMKDRIRDVLLTGTYHSEEPSEMARKLCDDQLAVMERRLSLIA